MTTSFWSNDPLVLFHIEFWPIESMTFEAKMNAISRTVILMTILGLIFTQNINLLFVGIITLAIIFSLYKIRKQNIVSSLTKEPFNNLRKYNKDDLNKKPQETVNPITLESTLRSEFHPTTKKNPFGNVLLTDIGDNPNRKAAAPSFNPDVYEDITKSVKKQTQMLNPDIINTNKQLYGDLKDNYDLDNSLMRFYSTANTRVDSDQGAFANYLYGDMYSAKEDTPEGAMMRVKDNWQWINP